MSSHTGEFELKQWLRAKEIGESADVIGVVSLLKRLNLNLKSTSLTLLEDEYLTAEFLRCEHIKISEPALMKLIELRNQLLSEQKNSAQVSDADTESEEEVDVFDEEADTESEEEVDVSNEEETSGQFKQNPYIVKVL